MSKLQLDKRHLNFGEIVELQSLLNRKADPKNPNWEEERTIEDFKLASVLEFVELIESTPWKWWKGGSTDHWNVKIELIDALHFLTSNIVLSNALNEENTVKFLGYLDDEEPQNPLFIDGSTENGVKRLDSLNFIRAIVNEDESFEMINDLMKSCGLKAYEISAIYIAKYALNEIRWAGGYALDQYKKMKKGYTDENGNDVVMEDNVFLLSLVNKFQENSDMTLLELRESVHDFFNNQNL